MTLTFNRISAGHYVVDGYDRLTIKRGGMGFHTSLSRWYVMLDGGYVLHRGDIISDPSVEAAKRTAARLLAPCLDCGVPRMQCQVPRCHDCGMRHTEMMLGYAAAKREVDVIDERHALAERILAADTDELALSLAKELIR